MPGKSGVSPQQNSVRDVAIVDPGGARRAGATKPWWRRLRRWRPGSRFPPGPTSEFSPFLNSTGCECPSGLDQSGGAVGWVTFVVPDGKDVYEFQPGLEYQAIRRYIMQRQRPAKSKPPRSKPVYRKVVGVARMVGCHPETVLRDIRRGHLALAKRKAGRSYLIAVPKHTAIFLLGSQCRN